MWPLEAGTVDAAAIPAGAGAELEADARWIAAQGVVESRHFVRSPLLSKFLLYVVTETLEGRQEEITEHQIGVRVFGRQASYRTVEDNIVRNYARQLRKRLAEYFADADSKKTIRIEIPVGGYVPVFPRGSEHDVTEGDNSLGLANATKMEAPDTRHTATIGPLAAHSNSQHSAAARKHGAPARWRPHTPLEVSVFIGYSVLLVLLTWAVMGRLQRGHSGTNGESDSGSGPTHAFWHMLLDGPENTYVVPPDAGFNLIEDISQQSVSLAEYIQNSYSELPLPHLDDHSRIDLRAQQLTDFVDLQIVARMLRLPEYNPDHVQLRFPRDLRLDDLKNSNAILIGSVCSNPWAEVKSAESNFTVLCGDRMRGSSIVNRQPRPGEQVYYASQWNEPTHVTYALISFVPNLGKSGHLLLLEGLDVAGTQAAAEAILQSSMVMPILLQATRADGSVAPFEMLLRSTSIQANATETQVIASRVHE